MRDKHLKEIDVTDGLKINELNTRYNIGKATENLAACKMRFERMLTQLTTNVALSMWVLNRSAGACSRRSPKLKILAICYALMTLLFGIAFFSSIAMATEDYPLQTGY